MGTALPSLSTVSSDVANAFSAIKQAEGSNPAYNNPLDLAEGDQGYGTFGAGITIFPTPQAGVAAGMQQLELMASGASRNYSPSESIADVGNTYAGGDSNWASNVAKALGVSINSPLFGGPASALGSAMGSAASSSTSGSTSGGILSGLLSSATNGAASTIGGYIQQYLGRGVAIILGLLLIAAGVFSFDRPREIAIAAGKEFGKSALA